MYTQIYIYIYVYIYIHIYIYTHIHIYILIPRQIASALIMHESCHTNTTCEKRSRIQLLKEDKLFVVRPRRVASALTMHESCHTNTSVERRWGVCGRATASCLSTESQWVTWYGVAMISRLLKIISLFCRISSFLQSSFAKETYDFREPANRSHPIHVNESRDTYVHESCRTNMTLKSKWDVCGRATASCLGTDNAWVVSYWCHTDSLDLWEEITNTTVKRKWGVCGKPRQVASTLTMHASCHTVGLRTGTRRVAEDRWECVWERENSLIRLLRGDEVFVVGPRQVASALTMHGSCHAVVSSQCMGHVIQIQLARRDY